MKIIFNILKIIYIAFILWCFSVNVASGFFMLIVTMAYIIPAYFLWKWIKKQCERHR